MNEEKSVPATLEAGKTYRHNSPQNKNGYFCDASFGDKAILTNVASRWHFTANGTRQYPDGTIEWSYSSEGRFLTPEN